MLTFFNRILTFKLKMLTNFGSVTTISTYKTKMLTISTLINRNLDKFRPTNPNFQLTTKISTNFDLNKSKFRPYNQNLDQFRP